MMTNVFGSMMITAETYVKKEKKIDEQLIVIMHVGDYGRSLHRTNSIY